MNSYKVVIIGAGSIGSSKPDHIDGPGTSNILTHAHAVDAHPNTELLAIVDTDDKQLLKAKTKWQPQMTMRSLDDFQGIMPDIVIVAVPTEYHYDVLMNIGNNYNPKLIIAEKPFCTDLKRAKIVQNKCVKREIPIAINYNRRFSKGHQEIKQQFENGDFGKALNCRVLYGRGLKHDGCHAIDLMRYFFGEIKILGEGLINGKDEKYQDSYAENGTYGNVIIDRDENDPTVYAKFNFEKCPHVAFMPCDGRIYGIFEVDICFEKCRIRLIDNGLYMEKYPVNQENEWGHKSLDYGLTTVIRTETGLNTALYNLIDNAVKFLDGKEDLICTSKDAVAVHEILEGL